MKKLIWLIFAGLFFMVIGCEKDSLFDFSDPLKDQNQERVTSRNDLDPGPAVTAGLAWLVDQQGGNGSFSSGYDLVARTGFAVTKLCDWTVEQGMNPADPAGLYYDEIRDGLAYIFTEKRIKVIDGEQYIIFNDNYGNHHETYNTAVALMAISAYRNPGEVIVPDIDGMTYKQLAQNMVDFFAASQNPDGGWRYYDTNDPSDQSNTGFVVLGLTAAGELGCVVPQDLKDNLSGYIDYTQNDVDGDPLDGGCGYTTPDYWVNVLKTGNLLFEMVFVGDAPTAPRVQDAMDFIERHWDAPTGNGWPPNTGWYPYDPLAMYCLMKGFINVDVETFGDPEVDWYSEFFDAIVTRQNPDGSWPQGTGTWLDPYLATVFNLLTLEKFTPQVVVPVAFDIKPTSCPNPFNMKSNGDLPVAILGTADFDVSEIDPATVRLEGVSPLRWATEDVAAPVTDPQDPCECTTDGPDGYTDLTLKFDRQELVNTDLLSTVEDGDVVEMTITGNLIDGRAFVGSDCVVILKKGKH